MKKYSILLKSTLSEEVEATHYYLEDGFWYFQNNKNEKAESDTVLVISASEIVWIRIN